jgi:hypothetical protein
MRDAEENISELSREGEEMEIEETTDARSL